MITKNDSTKTYTPRDFSRTCKKCGKPNPYNKTFCSDECMWSRTSEKHPTGKNDSTRAKILKEFKLTVAQSAPFTFLGRWNDADFDWLEQGFLKALARQREEIVRSFRDEVIGKDELHTGGFADANNDLIVNRNRLRAELRRKLDKLK